jgi:hypothetical protein
MTSPPTPTVAPALRAARAVLGLALAIGGQVLTFVAAAVAGRLAGAESGDLRSLGAVVGTLLTGQLLLLLGCVVVGGVLMARGRRDLGVGLLIGRVLGALVFAGWILNQTR